MLVLSGTADGQEFDTQLPKIFGDLSGNAPKSVLDVEDPIITDVTHGRNALCGPRRPFRHACTTRTGACYPDQSQTRTLTLRIARSSNTQTASRRTHRRYAVVNDALHVPLLAVMPQKKTSAYLPPQWRNACHGHPFSWLPRSSTRSHGLSQSCARLPNLRPKEPLCHLCIVINQIVFHLAAHSFKILACQLGKQCMVYRDEP